MYQLSEEQAALRDAVRGLLERRSTVRTAMESKAGYDTGLWDTLCGEIGVAGLGIPEEFGGAGAGLRELCVVAEELGRTLTPSPFLGSAGYAAQALLASGDAGAGAELLPGIAEGRIAAVAVAGESGDWTTPAPVLTPDGLSGSAHYVLDGGSAEILLVGARTPDGIGLFVVDPDQDAVEREAVVGVDLTRRLATVRLDNATGRRIGFDAEKPLRQALDAASVVLAAEQVGAAERCLDLTVDYTKTRVQFGRAIGSFQAIKHRLADLYVLVETARSAAVVAAEDGDAESVRVAKVYCAEAFAQVTAEMIQLHGGIAITWEHDAHLYFKRAHASAHLFGAPNRAVAELAELAGITPGR